ncbi:hypothetical protein [Arenimonas sp.]|uniref:hypothetical protein n=1 Tax=Arenimonas sp. TaxID=1872635 RepID=UPI002E3678B6|nr:hypothetical protein [Arenimonas sp.]HEX4854370.1 hypothetical protein [Arenimonas sp.]
MLRTTLVLCALSAAPVFAADAAATLSAQEGTVLVNQGDDFTTATEAQALAAGDRVLVMEGSRAELTFADGCLLPLAAGSLLDVPAVSPCAGGVAGVQRIGPSFAEAEEGEKPVRKGTNAYVIGTVAVVGAALLLGGGGGDDKPASP